MTSSGRRGNSAGGIIGHSTSAARPLWQKERGSSLSRSASKPAKAIARTPDERNTPPPPVDPLLQTRLKLLEWVRQTKSMTISEVEFKQFEADVKRLDPQDLQFLWNGRRGGAVKDYLEMSRPPGGNKWIR